MQIRLGRVEITEAIERWVFDRLQNPYQITSLTIGKGGQHITVDVERLPEGATEDIGVAEIGAGPGDPGVPE